MAKALRASYRQRSAKKPDPELAVAVSYDGLTVPKLSCVRLGAAASNVVSAARRYGIPIRRDTQLAERLGSLEEDEAIPVELFEDVAGVLAGVLDEEF